MITGPLLAPHLLERLGGLDLIAHAIVAGLVSGPHPSSAQGAGEDFFRHRAYQQGDDLRNLDWRVYARTDRLYVREYRSDSDLQAVVVVDATRSMDFGDRAGVTKRRYAAYLAAALTLLMLRAGDQVGLASFGEAPRLHLLPRRRVGQLNDLLRALERLESDGGTSAAGALELAASALRRRGRVVLISDLLEPDDGQALLTALGRIRARGDEVIVLRPLTPAELGEEAPAGGVLFDPERPDLSVPARPSVDPGYRERVARFYDRLAAGMAERGVEYVPLSTTTPVEKALAVWLRARRR